MAAGQGERVIVVDAPDLFRINKDELGPRFSSLGGREVYSNAGKRIGEIEDFVLTKGGQVYAVIDTSKGPIRDLLKGDDGETVIVPIQELRQGVRATVIKGGARSSAQ